MSGLWENTGADKARIPEAQVAEPQGRIGEAVSEAASAPSAAPAPLARFRLLYESRDKKMCLFEDAEGHLTAVNSASLI